MWKNKTPVEVENLLCDIPLYCVPSMYGSLCNYVWRNLSYPKKEFSNSSVIYVRQGGMYKCVVSCGSMKDSCYLEVRVIPGNNYTISFDRFDIKMYITGSTIMSVNCKFACSHILM